MTDQTLPGSFRRGHIVLAELDPVVSPEQGKTRPAIVVSNDHANTHAARLGRGLVTIIPLTTNVARVREFQVFVAAESSGLPRDSKAQTEQIRSLSVTRIARAIGRLDAETLGAVDEALRIHLHL